MALAPEDMDFISNFSTIWAVFLGAVLATVGGFAATQIEWYIERRRRERNAALFFGEVLATLHLVLNFAANSTKVGDPYGPVTIRMFRSALGEVDIYNRNRETLYDLRHPELRARIHTLILRVSMTVDSIFDQTNTMTAIGEQLDSLQQEMAKSLAATATQLARRIVRSELSARPECVVQVAEQAVETLLQSARHIVVRLHPDDHALVASGASEAIAARGARLVADASVTRGGCRVDSDIGGVDASLEERWRMAVAALGAGESWADATPAASGM